MAHLDPEIGVLARLHYRGKPNRHLRGLRLGADAAATGDELTFEGRAVGRLGSVAVSPRFGPIALALVRREAPVGSVVAVGDGDGDGARSSSCRSARQDIDLPIQGVYTTLSIGSLIQGARHSVGQQPHESRGSGSWVEHQLRRVRMRRQVRRDDPHLIDLIGRQMRVRWPCSRRRCTSSTRGRSSARRTLSLRRAPAHGLTPGLVRARGRAAAPCAARVRDGALPESAYDRGPRPTLP